ncbi:MAG: cytochrome D1 domain-containing protein [Hydrogenobacter sp.]
MRYLFILFVSAFTCVEAFASYVFVSDEEEGIYVIDADKLELVKRVELKDLGIRGIGVTKDGKYLAVASKKLGKLLVVSTENWKIVKEIPLGENPEFVKVHPKRDLLFVTYEETGKEERAYIVAIDTKNWKVSFKFEGGKESEGMAFSKDGKYLLVTNEGENSLSVYDLDTKKKLKDVNLKPYGERPRGVVCSPDGNYYAVTFESSNNMILLDNNFKPLRSVKTDAGPYGVTYSPDGSEIIVASFRAGKLDIYDARTLSKKAFLQTGKRCWHFTYTSDYKKLVVPCGNSKNVLFFDTKDLRLIKSMDNLGKPWGAVAFPRAWGSIDTP